MKPEDFNLLIVDDEEGLREVLVMNFKMNGYNIFQASGGLEAIEIVKSNRIDFIISDIRMPDGDGVFLLEKIREIDPDIPIIVMVTGFAQITREEIIKKGALDLLEKPYDIELLESHIEKHMRSISR